MGLRNGGGISESLTNIKSYTDPVNKVSSGYYWGRYFYDLSFFILINMLFIQIIFGIILDTFGELRGQQDKVDQEILNKCFICVRIVDRSIVFNRGLWLFVANRV